MTWNHRHGGALGLQPPQLGVDVQCQHAVVERLVRAVGAQDHREQLPQRGTTGIVLRLRQHVGPVDDPLAGRIVEPRDRRRQRQRLAIPEPDRVDRLVGERRQRRLQPVLQRRQRGHRFRRECPGQSGAGRPRRSRRGIVQRACRSAPSWRCAWNARCAPAPRSGSRRRDRRRSARRLRGTSPTGRSPAAGSRRRRRRPANAAFSTLAKICADAVAGGVLSAARHSGSHRPCATRRGSGASMCATVSYGARTKLGSLQLAHPGDVGDALAPGQARARPEDPSAVPACLPCGRGSASARLPAAATAARSSADCRVNTSRAQPLRHARGRAARRSARRRRAAGAGRCPAAVRRAARGARGRPEPAPSRTA